MILLTPHVTFLCYRIFIHYLRSHDISKDSQIYFLKPICHMTLESTMSRYRGSNFLRQRLVLSTVSGRPVVITDIRVKAHRSCRLYPCTKIMVARLSSSEFIFLHKFDQIGCVLPVSAKLNPMFAHTQKAHPNNIIYLSSENE